MTIYLIQRKSLKTLLTCWESIQGLSRKGSKTSTGSKDSQPSRKSSKNSTCSWDDDIPNISEEDEDWSSKLSSKSIFDTDSLVTRQVIF